MNDDWDGSTRSNFGTFLIVVTLLFYPLITSNLLFAQKFARGH